MYSTLWEAAAWHKELSLVPYDDLEGVGWEGWEGRLKREDINILTTDSLLYSLKLTQHCIAVILQLKIKDKKEIQNLRLHSQPIELALALEQDQSDSSRHFCSEALLSTKMYIERAAGSV